MSQLQDLEKRGAKNTLEDCKEVLKTYFSEKSPDEDSFTLEFYDCFFDVLSEDIINCYNASRREREMSISQPRGTITLILKEDSNLLHLKSGGRLLY